MTHATWKALMATAPGVEQHAKSHARAYLLWFLTGLFGGHRFYLGHSGSATVILMLTLLSPLLLLFGIGALTMMIVVVWVLIDLFRIGGMVDDYNTGLIIQHHVKRAMKASATA